MTDALEFTDEEIRIIEGLYTATDSAECRQFVRDALDLQPSEDVISIGCGPGRDKPRKERRRQAEPPTNPMWWTGAACP